MWDWDGHIHTTIYKITNKNLLYNMYQGVLYVPKGTDLVTLRAAVHQIKYTCICFHVGLSQCKHSVSQVLKNPPAKKKKKESTCNAGDVSSISGPGRSPGGKHGNPLQYSCQENPMDREAWQATVHGVAKELDMTEWLNNNNRMKNSQSHRAEEECWVWKLSSVKVCYVSNHPSQDQQSFLSISTTPSSSSNLQKVEAENYAPRGVRNPVVLLRYRWPQLCSPENA